MVSNEGCLCQECLNRFKVDIMLPSNLWKQITDKNILCGQCIIKHLENLGYLAFELIEIK